MKAWKDVFRWVFLTCVLCLLCFSASCVGFDINNLFGKKDIPTPTSKSSPKPASTKAGGEKSIPTSTTMPTADLTKEMHSTMIAETIVMELFFDEVGNKTFQPLQATRRNLKPTLFIIDPYVTLLIPACGPTTCPSILSTPVNPPTLQPGMISTPMAPPTLVPITLPTPVRFPIP